MKSKIAYVLILSLAFIIMLGHSMIPHHHHDEVAVKAVHKTHHHHHHHGVAHHHHHDSETPEKESDNHNHPPHHVHANLALLVHNGQNLKNYAPRHFSHVPANGNNFVVAAPTPLLHKNHFHYFPKSLLPGLITSSGLRAPPALFA